MSLKDGGEPLKCHSIVLNNTPYPNRGEKKNNKKINK